MQQVAIELTSTPEWCSNGITLSTLRGATRPTSWTPPITTSTWGLTLARRGGYRRRADGFEHIVDVNTGFLRGPGQEVSTATFATHEELTTMQLDAPFLHHLPDLSIGRGPITVEPRVALAHRLLLRRLEDTPDALGIESAVMSVIYRCLRQVRTDPRIECRRSTAVARRRLVTDALEVLVSSFHEQQGLVDLARLVGASPYHLSRVFREVTGITLSHPGVCREVVAVDHTSCG